MRPISAGVGCAIAVLSTLTAAVANPIYVIEETSPAPIHKVPPTIGTPSIIGYPWISDPYSRNSSIPVVPTLPTAPITPTQPQPSSFIWPYSQHQTTPSTPTHFTPSQPQPSSFIWPYSPPQTTTLSEIYYPDYSTYRYRRYPSSRSRIIYINPNGSQTRETIIIYRDPAFSH